MKKLFISQPMRGKSNEEILAIRSDATQAAKDAVGEEVEVIDSFFIVVVLLQNIFFSPQA